MYLRQLLWEFFGMPKILTPLTELVPMEQEIYRRSYDGLRCSQEWLGIFTTTPEFEDFLNRMSICGQFWDSLRLLLPNNRRKYWGNLIESVIAESYEVRVLACILAKLILHVCTSNSSKRSHLKYKSYF